MAYNEGLVGNTYSPTCRTQKAFSNELKTNLNKGLNSKYIKSCALSNNRRQTIKALVNDVRVQVAFQFTPATKDTV